MRVLHIASFNGNIGDNAHHNGFRWSFEAVFNDIEWVDLEIRNFYKSWGVSRFDKGFANYANRFDLVVIGGGNFFEICHDYSATGCTIDISGEIMDSLNVPIFFNALGFDTHKGYTTNTKSRFLRFIEKAGNSDRYYITFRNDGSLENFKNVYGSMPSYIRKIPDGGFFLKVDLNADHSSTADRQIIGVNLARDMLEKRLSKKSYEAFCCDLASAFRKMVEKYGVELRFFPHILTDISIIYDVCKSLGERIVKYNVSVAPYMTGQGAEKVFFSHYNKCSVVTGMRFHSNVCAFGLNIPTVPVVTYPKLEHVYQDIGYMELLTYGDSDDFEPKYFRALEKALIEDRIDTIAALQKLEEEQSAVLQDVGNWFRRLAHKYDR